MSSSVPSPPRLVGWSLPWLPNVGSKDNIEAGLQDHGRASPPFCHGARPCVPDDPRSWPIPRPGKQMTAQTTPKPSARIVSCGAPQWQRCSPLPTGREGRLPCPSPIQQISRLVPADRVKNDAYASGFCHTRFLQRLTPTRWSSPRTPGLSARMGTPRGAGRRTERPVIGGITIRNQAKTISSTG